MCMYGSMFVFFFLLFLFFFQGEDGIRDLVRSRGLGDVYKRQPYNASALLLAGVQDVTEIMASGKYKLEDLIMLVLETYYNSLGFRFITLCLRDQKINLFRARSSLG